MIKILFSWDGCALLFYCCEYKTAFYQFRLTGGKYSSLTVPVFTIGYAVDNSFNPYLLNVTNLNEKNKWRCKQCNELFIQLDDWPFIFTLGRLGGLAPVYKYLIESEKYEQLSIVEV